MTNSKGIGRGGRRAGAGRKLGTKNKPNIDHLYAPCAGALGEAMNGATVWQFILAMQMLEAPLDDVPKALGLSRDQFAKDWGPFLKAVAEHRRAADQAMKKSRRKPAALPL